MKVSFTFRHPRAETEPNMTIRFLLMLFCIAQFSFGQAPLPQGYFKSPLNIPLRLAGTFGELRSNHFHSGMDIKTQQRTGLDVLASASGYVSRIKISSYGYGKAIYVQHPNGYTTVYGHLSDFSPEIRKYIRKHQYKKESYAIQLFPEKNKLPVKQGEVIAKSGETGGAGGPHLHFEIRDGQQRPINPMAFGIKIEDHRPPIVNSLFVYPTGKDSHLNKSAQRQRLRLIPQKDGSYKTETFYAYGKLGFGISTFDRTDHAANPDGVYKIKTCLNGEPRFGITFKRFSFAKSRYINRFIDYSYYKKNRKRIQKLFLQPNNDIDMNLESVNKGYIQIGDSLNYSYKITVEDFAGNATIIRVPIKTRKVPENEIKPKEVDTTDYLAFANKANVFTLKNYDIYIPKNALYEDTYLDLEVRATEIKVHNKLTPLHKNITIGFDASDYSKKDREKLYVARTYPWGTKYYSKTHKEGSRITTRTRTFGTFKLESDETPPTVKPVNFYNKKWMSHADFLKVKIKDKDSGISTYRGTINGKFIVMQYDYKTHILKYDFRDNVVKKTENNLKIIVVDNVGNNTTFESTFFRKELKH